MEHTEEKKQAIAAQIRSKVDELNALINEAKTYQMHISINDSGKNTFDYKKRFNVLVFEIVKYY